MYSINLATGQPSQLTDFFTGITGITFYAPAISASRNSNQVVYTYYNNNAYHIYIATPNELLKNQVPSTDNRQAGMIPPFNRLGNEIVQQNMENTSVPLPDPSVFVSKPYRSKFRLDYIGNTGVGISTGAGYGMGVGGGINGLFSDMLGNHQLFGSLALNGELYDFGGQFAYFNSTGRLNWGTSISHIPYLSGIQRLFRDTLVLNNTDTVEVANLSTDLLRTFEDQVAFYTAYPFSQTRRIEGGASFARYYYRLDRYSDYYTPDGQVYIGSEKIRQPTPGGFNFGQGYLAFVGDNSQFGVASPLTGHRFRVEAARYLGVVNMSSFLGDYRRYFRFHPFTFATRNMYVGRFGKDAESGIIPPLYIGYPFYVRGYEATGFAEETSGDELSLNDLIGSKMFVSNVELRYPFTGPERLSAIRSRILFSELALFTDGGIAWGNPSSPSGDNKDDIIPRDSKFVMSSGVSLRVNLFGYIVIEPFYAIPWQNGGFSNARFGLNFMPGW
jgi:hypothetical protein